MIAFLQVLGSFLGGLTPLGLAGLLALIIFRQAGKNRQAITELKDNHLHDLADKLDVINENISDMRREQAAAHATIIAKLNGRG